MTAERLFLPGSVQKIHFSGLQVIYGAHYAKAAALVVSCGFTSRAMSSPSPYGEGAARRGEDEHEDGDHQLDALIEHGG